MTSQKIILASQSPARKKLLQKLFKPLGLKFRCYPSGYDENMAAYKNPRKLAIFLALNKAKFIAHKFPNAIIIGADTFITVGAKKIGKPRTIKEAKQIIASMSGKTISVHSGIAVIKTDPTGKIANESTDYDLTKLKIKTMSQAEINFLALQKNALKISGAFSIEGAGGKMITRITGDYDNVIGLPIYKLIKLI